MRVLQAWQLSEDSPQDWLMSQSTAETLLL